MSFLAINEEEVLSQRIEDSYNRIGVMLWKIAFGIVKNEDDAFDVVQNTFLKAMEHMDYLKGLSNNEFDSYLVVIAKNLCYMMFRQRKNDEKASEIELLVVDDDIIGNTIMDELDREKLISVLNKLPSNYYSLIHLKYYLRLNNKELARTMNTSASNVRMMHTRAIRLLRKLFDTT